MPYLTKWPAVAGVALVLLPHLAIAATKPNDLAAIEQAAIRGDKLAQLRLGDRYRLGDGVAKNPAKARKWYRRAAKDIVRRSYAYSSPVGHEAYGRPIATGETLVEPGLAEAKARLLRND